MRPTVLAGILAISGILTAGAMSARAQGVRYSGGAGYPSGWSGYAPSYPWGSYAPSGWSGYSPAPRIIVPPGGAWTGYVPQQGAVVAGTPTAPPPYYIVEAPRAQPSRARSRSIISYREFGTGRPVPLAKPWLPNSP